MTTWLRWLHGGAGIAAFGLVSAVAFVAYSGVADCGVSRADYEYRANFALIACAKFGHARAQAQLAILYLAADPEGAELFGLPAGEARDFQAHGRRLLESAASSGSAISQNELGLAYLEGGLGYPQDVARARALLEQAAAGGDMIAPLNLARMYLSGAGMPASEPQAESLLRLSVMRGYTRANCSLASLLERQGRAAGEVAWLRSDAERRGDHCSSDVIIDEIDDDAN